MSGSPRFSLFRPWVELSSLKKTNGDRRGLLPLTDVDDREERKANVKHAWFFTTVAVLFLLADQLGHVKNVSDSNSVLASAEHISLALSPQEGPRDRVGLSVRFRLSNKGNHSIFYPVRPETDVPLGQIVTRTSPSSEWISPATVSEQPISAVPGLVDTNPTWIEMPPGGWVDGEYQDLGEFLRDHAYLIYVKLARDANSIRIISNSYHSLAIRGR
jgi:hypothetical protein